MSASGNGNSNGYITIQELLERIDSAKSGMGTQNPNRHLLEQCKVAITYLSNMVPAGEVRTKGGIILP